MKIVVALVVVFSVAAASAQSQTAKKRVYENVSSSSPTKKPVKR